jgi:flagellar biosynthetic protein FlhB
MAGERTEQATPRRRQRAREQGDRPRSRDLLAASATLAGTLAMGWLGPGWLAGWRLACERFLRLGMDPAWRREEGVAAMLGLRAVAVEAMLPLVAVLAACAGAALVAGIGQGGGIDFHASALAPKWTRVDPVSNGKNLFSLRAASRMGKTLLPVAVLSVLAWGRLTREAELPVFSLERMPRAMADAYGLLLDAAWILLLWSAIDYAVEWRSWTGRLRMSRQELRDEYKETEGNPQVRGRIRNIQRQMRARMLRADVARASVVITNPDHYAVALGFDFATMDAPRVLAKGRNLLAGRIKDEARWAGIPIVENPPLARSLYRRVEPGQAIPFELYAAVAGILAYLYRRQVEERLRRQAREAAAAAAPGAGAPRNPGSPRPPGAGRLDTDVRVTKKETRSRDEEGDPMRRQTR